MSALIPHPELLNSIIWSQFGQRSGLSDWYFTVKSTGQIFKFIFLLFSDFRRWLGTYIHSLASLVKIRKLICYFFLTLTSFSFWFCSWDFKILQRKKRKDAKSEWRKKKCKSIIYLPQVEKDEIMTKLWTASSSNIKSTILITVLSFDHLDFPDFLTKISRIFEISPNLFWLFVTDCLHAPTCTAVVRAGTNQNQNIRKRDLEAAFLKIFLNSSWQSNNQKLSYKPANLWNMVIKIS